MAGIKKRFCKRGHDKDIVGRRADGSRCSACERERGRKRYRANPEKKLACIRLWRARNLDKIKEYPLKQKYGLSLGQVETLIRLQEGRCANPGCRVLFDRGSKKTRPCVDHNHECCPGKITCGKCVRGILCGSCNVGLGCFREDHTILQGALAYMKKWQVSVGVA